MHYAIVDFETFWDVKYTLKQLSITDYVHDDRFEIHGASVSLDFEEPRWLRGPGLQDWIMSLPRPVTLIAHHTLFDGYINTYAFDYEFDEYFCTMGMIEALFQGAIGRGLDEAMKTLLGWKIGKTDILARTKGLHWDEFTDEQREAMITYANRDLQGTIDLYQQYSAGLPASEHGVMSTILKMFCHPRLEFDDELLYRALSAAEEEREEEIQKAIDFFGCDEDDLRGQNSFAALIEQCGIPMPMKPSPSNSEKMIPALAKTDQGFIDLLEHDDPRVQALAEARRAVKSTQGITRAQRFIDLHEAVGYLPVAYNYHRAHTGRLTGANKINLANLKRASDLRKSVIAPKGYVIGVADSSQIEARADGYLAGQDDLMQLFRDKRDPYNDMASEIFNRPVDRKGNPDDFIEGFIGKTAVLGLGFQMGAFKFQMTANMGAKSQLGIDLDLPMEDAFRAVEVYRQKNYKIVQFWEAAEQMLQAMVLNDEPYDFEYYDGVLHVDTKNNRLWFPNGTCLFYPCLSYDEGQFTYVTKLGSKYVNRYIYGGKFVENIVQKFARDIVVWQMQKIAEQRRVVLHTYDENGALLPEETADEDLEWMLEVMRTPPPWAASIPLDAEGGWAKEYSK